MQPHRRGRVPAPQGLASRTGSILLEIGATGLRSWLDALGVVEALSPREVVAGHKNKDLPDDPAIIAQTR